jgi:psiF repeat
MLKQLTIAALLTLPLAAMAADEAKSDKPANSQQNKMATCNKDAGARNLEGDARKTFLSECLSLKGKPSAARTAQQEKMSSCNKDAGARSLKGDDRRKFMSTCLKA